MNRKAKGEPNGGGDGATVSGSPPDKANPRAERLAEELRSNLKKRKDQGRARAKAGRERPD
jgi:hypothetical protein